MRGGTAKISRAGFTDDSAMKPIGSSDHNSMAAIATALPAPIASRSMRIRYLTTQAPDVPGGQQQRHRDHKPTGGCRRTERIVAECLVIEIHRDNFGATRRTTGGEQPDLGKQAEGDDLAEKHRHQDRWREQRQGNVAKALE